MRLIISVSLNSPGNKVAKQRGHTALLLLALRKLGGLAFDAARAKDLAPGAPRFPRSLRRGRSVASRRGPPLIARDKRES